MLEAVAIVAIERFLNQNSAESGKDWPRIGANPLTVRGRISSPESIFINFQ